jgi:predicted MFS family arabinose efflux permease
VAAGLLRRLYRLVFGDDVDPALRPVLALGTVGAIANSAVFTYVGIWALDELGASQKQLAVGFLVGALLAGAFGYLGGHLSDHLGRRPLMLAGWAGNIVVLPILAFVHDVWLGIAVLALEPMIGSLGQSATTAIVADLVPEERQEASYAALRVANNLGVSIGPPIGALLLIGQHWPRLFLGVALLSAAGWVLAYRTIPERGAFAPEEPPTRGSFSVIRRDRPFLIFMGSSILASATYVAFETLLPISLVQSHGLAPSVWGFLVIANPILVTFLQLRLTRAVSGVPASVKLGIAMPMMGLPFLLLNVTAAIPVVLLVVVVFVFGEMLWIPTSQTVVASFAPADLRGAYMGVFGASWAIAWALGPFSGLQVRAEYGDAVLWSCVAVVGVVAGITGAAAARGHHRAAAEVASPA